MFPLLSADRTVTVELGVARRFVERWEADASLQLRRQAASVLAVYDRHGRICGGTGEQVLEAALDLTVLTLSPA